MPDNNTNSRDDLLIKWLNGELSDAEVNKEIGDENLNKYRQILSEVDQWQPSTDTKVFDPSIIINDKPKAKQRFLTPRQIMSIAASFLILVVAGYLFLGQQKVNHLTSFGEIKEIILPDGKSKVILGPNSKISWKKKDWESSNRLLSLEGKAHFKVEPGDPFRVNTSNGFIEVLGTAFDINQFDKSIDVKCYEGKVRAKGSSGESVILKAGQSNIFHNNNWEQTRLMIDKEPIWVQVELKFDNAPISLVIKELISLYDIKVDIGSINLERRFTGSIPTKNLDQSLQIVFGTLGIIYQLEGKELTLSE